MNRTGPLACDPFPWQCLTTQPNQLGESPFWHPLEHKLYWIDIPARQVLRMQEVSGTVETWDLPSEPGCIAPAASGGLVLALRHGVFRARQWGGPLLQIATLDYDPAYMRANDGKCDALGRFWIGTIDETKSAHNAALYCLDCRNGLVPHPERKLEHAITANGLAWSPDGGILYWSDTPSHAVRAWNFDAPLATLSAERTFHQFAPKSASLPVASYGGRPDGAAVDAEGNYFVALYEGRRVCQLAPDGTLLAQWETPAQCPTMVCFGGDDLRTLYLTSARQKRSTEELKVLPLSGCIFSMRVKVPGLPVNFFAD
jgi:sugar lactone lactonase YvrE